MTCRREYLPTPGFLPEDFHGQRSLMGYSSWGHKAFQVPVQYCSLWCWTLLSPLDTFTAECRFCFGQTLQHFWSYFIALYSSLVAYGTPSNLGSSSFISYLSVFSYCYGVLLARIMEWFAISCSSGPSCRTLQCHPSILRDPAWHGS